MDEAMKKYVETMKRLEEERERMIHEVYEEADDEREEDVLNKIKNL